MIENIRTHPYTHAVCLETARLFERRAAKNLVAAQHWVDEGLSDRAREFQAKARLAQERANAWHRRARHAPYREVRNRPPAIDLLPRTSMRSHSAPPRPGEAAAI